MLETEGRLLPAISDTLQLEAFLVRLWISSKKILADIRIASSAERSYTQ